MEGLETLPRFRSFWNSFFGYEMATDWSNFKNELDEFVVINEETLKINLFIALPALI